MENNGNDGMDFEECSETGRNEKERIQSEKSKSRKGKVLKALQKLQPFLIITIAAFLVCVVSQI